MDKVKCKYMMPKNVTLYNENTVNPQTNIYPLSQQALPNKPINSNKNIHRNCFIATNKISF